jgi:hypothetical protein
MIIICGNQLIFISEGINALTRIGPQGAGWTGKANCKRRSRLVGGLNDFWKENLLICLHPLVIIDFDPATRGRMVIVKVLREGAIGKRAETARDYA